MLRQTSFRCLLHSTSLIGSPIDFFIDTLNESFSLVLSLASLITGSHWLHWEHNEPPERGWTNSQRNFKMKKDLFLHTPKTKRRNSEDDGNEHHVWPLWKSSSGARLLNSFMKNPMKGLSGWHTEFQAGEVEAGQSLLRSSVNRKMNSKELQGTIATIQSRSDRRVWLIKGPVCKYFAVGYRCASSEVLRVSLNELLLRSSNPSHSTALLWSSTFECCCQFKCSSEFECSSGIPHFYGIHLSCSIGGVGMRTVCAVGGSLGSRLAQEEKPGTAVPAL